MIFSMTNLRISSLRHVGRVLRRDDDRVDAHRLVAVVLDRDLALAVGPQPVDFALLAGFGQPVEDAVRQRDRQRHQLGRVVAGVAEHQALVAGADVLALRPRRR